MVKDHIALLQKDQSIVRFQWETGGDECLVGITGDGARGLDGQMFPRYYRRVEARKIWTHYVNLGYHCVVSATQDSQGNTNTVRM